MVSYTRAKSEGLGFTAGHRYGGHRDHAARGPPRDPVGRPASWPASLGAGPTAGCADCAARHLAPSAAPRRSSPSARPHHHPADPPRPQPAKQHIHRPSQHGEQQREQERQQRQANGATPSNTWAGAGRRKDGKIRVAIVGVGQLRQQPRPGPLLLRERQEGRLRPGPDARRPRRLPRPRHRVRRRLRHRQEQGRQGPVRGDLHQAEQHVRLPAGRPTPASPSSAA